MKLTEFIEKAPPCEMVLDSFCKLQYRLELCNSALVAISGGWDSDMLIDLVSKADDEKKAEYVFFNTGIEYEATKKHLKDLGKKYNVNILEYKAKIPVPLACKKYGQPFLSKYCSDMIERLQRHNFKWENKPFDELYLEYPQCKGALRWWCNDWGDNSRFNINYYPFLKEFMIKNPPKFNISPKCCTYSKKNPSKEAQKKGGYDLSIIGVRKSEGGIRSTSYKSCFSTTNKNSIAQLRPLWWITNEDKKMYCNTFNITPSDCYNIYGLKRTGCAGCPFGKNFEFELEVIEKYEPKLYKAVINIFGNSYEYTRNYYKFRKEQELQNERDII